MQVSGLGGPVGTVLVKVCLGVDSEVRCVLYDINIMWVYIYIYIQINKYIHMHTYIFFLRAISGSALPN